MNRDPSGHENSLAAPAAGDLELVRGFLSLHDHLPGVEESLAPGPGTIEGWLRAADLLPADAEASGLDLEWADRVREALRTKVHETMGAERDHSAIDLLNEAARDTGLQICFGCAEGGRLHTTSDGVRGAVGRLLGIAFFAELEGSFQQLKECESPTCTSVFYDRSKNHSGKWCSMQSCGNRAKVRAFRERERRAAPT